MDDKIYTITLADGTVIENLRKNGNNFISTGPLEESVFAGRLSTVTISDGEEERVLTNAELIKFEEEDPGYWFILRPISKERLEKMQLLSDIEYLAMMTGVDL